MQVDPNAPKKSSKKGSASDIKSKGAPPSPLFSKPSPLPFLPSSLHSFFFPSFLPHSTFLSPQYNITNTFFILTHHSTGGLNPLALIILLIAIAAGVYFTQKK